MTKTTRTILWLAVVLVAVVALLVPRLQSPGDNRGSEAEETAEILEVETLVVTPHLLIEQFATVGTIIDVSSASSTRAFLGKLWANSHFALDNAHKLGIAHRQQEVLVAFRGAIPSALFEVVDENTGASKGPLDRRAEVA